MARISRLKEVCTWHLELVGHIEEVTAQSKFREKSMDGSGGNGRCNMYK